MVALSKLSLQIKFCNKIPPLCTSLLLSSPQTHTYCSHYLTMPIPRNLDWQDIHPNRIFFEASSTLNASPNRVAIKHMYK